MQLVITTVTAEGAAGFNAASIIAILTSEARVEWKREISSDRQDQS